MPKQSKRGEAGRDISMWALIGMMAFSAAASSFLLVKHFQDQELVCRVKGVDQLTGLVLLECGK